MNQLVLNRVDKTVTLSISFSVVSFFISPDSKENKLESVMVNEKEVWESPVLEDLGDAKDLIQHVSIMGSGDSQFSILDPT